MSAAETIEKLLERRLLIVIGKGGVGRYQYQCGRLGLASRGQRVLLIEASLMTPILAAAHDLRGFRAGGIAPATFLYGAPWPAIPRRIP